MGNQKHWLELTLCIFVTCVCVGRGSIRSESGVHAAHASPPYQAHWESLDKRPMPQWFNEAKFGIFVVWGPYSVPAWAAKGQYAEWYRYRLEDKNSPTWRLHAKTYGEDFKYEQFAPLLKAELWDPDAWADLFARAGAKYVVTTANYHDGFCLYPTLYDGTVNTDKWNSTEVGPMRDVLGELNEAGRKRGLKMGIYYSLYEWFHPLWVTDRDRYVREKLHPQFKEVVTKYKPPVIFLDGEWEMDYKRWRSEELAAWLFNESPVREYVVVNDRWGQCRGQHGSFYESEYGGGTGWIDHPWQEDRGIGKSYGYNRNESIDDYDTGEVLIRMLSKVTGNGGNYLLDVGPTADGRIPVIMQDRLLQIGAWLKVNGEAVYGSQGSPFRPRRLAWGTCTYKPGHIFAHVHGRRWKAFTLPGLKNHVAGAYLLSDETRSPLPLERQDSGVTIHLPDCMPGEPVSIVVVEIEGTPIVDLSIQQEEDGSVVLPATEATIHGASPRYETGGGKDDIGYWGDPKDYVSWTFQLTSPGEFTVEVVYSCARGAAGSRFEVSVGDDTLTAETRETGAWNRFESQVLGRVQLRQVGRYTLIVRPGLDTPWKSMGLQSVRLRRRGSQTTGRARRGDSDGGERTFPLNQADGS